MEGRLLTVQRGSHWLWKRTSPEGGAGQEARGSTGMGAQKTDGQGTCTLGRAWLSLVGRRNSGTIDLSQKERDYFIFCDMKQSEINRNAH